MPQPNSQLITAIRDVLSECQVELAIVFGSVVSGALGGESDVDVAVDAGHILTPPEKMSLIDAIAARTGRPVDLLDLRVVGEPVLGKILSGGILLLGSKTQYGDLIRKHLFDAADFMPYRTRILRHRRDAWIAK